MKIRHTEVENRDTIFIDCVYGFLHLRGAFPYALFDMDSYKLYIIYDAMIEGCKQVPVFHVYVTMKEPVR